MKNEKTVMSNDKPIGFFLDLFFDGWVKKWRIIFDPIQFSFFIQLCEKLKLYSNIYKQLFWAKCVILSNLKYGHFFISCSEPVEEEKWVTVKLNMNYGSDDRAKRRITTLQKEFIASY